MDKIFIHGMKFYGYHGVFPEENKLGQRFIVDLTLEADLRAAAKEDELEHSVDYAQAYAAVKQIVEGKTYDLVESVAERIANQMLETFAIVERLTVKVIKPDPPIAGHYDYVAVEITRERR